MQDNVLNLANPVNRAAPLNRGLTAWWLALAQSSMVPSWFDLGTRKLRAAAGTALPSRVGARRMSGHSSLAFAQNANYMEVADNPALDLESNCTIAFWIYVRSYVDGSILSKFANGTSSTGTEMRGVRIDGASLYVTEENSNRLNLATWVTIGGWHHVCLAIASDKSLIGYVNAQSRATATTAGTFFNTAHPLRIGAPQATFFNSYEKSANFLLDDLRFYNRAISASEVGRLYNASRTGYQQELNWLDRPWLMGVPDVAPGGMIPYVIGGGCGGANSIIGA
jgi:hypothetical protein